MSYREYTFRNSYPAKDRRKISFRIAIINTAIYFRIYDTLTQLFALYPLGTGVIGEREISRESAKFIKMTNVRNIE